jgi:hypothetical protein
MGRGGGCGASKGSDVLPANPTPTQRAAEEDDAAAIAGGGGMAAKKKTKKSPAKQARDARTALALEVAEEQFAVVQLKRIAALREAKRNLIAERIELEEAGKKEDDATRALAAAREEGLDEATLDTLSAAVAVFREDADSAAAGLEASVRDADVAASRAAYAAMESAADAAMAPAPIGAGTGETTLGDAAAAASVRAKSFFNSLRTSVSAAAAAGGEGTEGEGGNMQSMAVGQGRPDVQMTGVRGSTGGFRYEYDTVDSGDGDGDGADAGGGGRGGRGHGGGSPAARGGAGGGGGGGSSPGGRLTSLDDER